MGDKMKALRTSKKHRRKCPECGKKMTSTTKIIAEKNTADYQIGDHIGTIYQCDKYNTVVMK